MSDSEDEGAFASADEGEAGEAAATSKASAKAKAKKTTPKPVDAKTADDDKTKGEKSEKTGAKTGKGQQNKKGKGSKPVQQNTGASKSSEKQTAAVSKGAKKNENVETTNAQTKLPKENTKKTETQSKETTKPDLGKTDEAKKSAVQPNVKKDETKCVESDQQKETTKEAGAVRRDLQKESEMKVPESQNIPAEQRDHHTAKQEEVLHRLEETANQSSGGGWGWGWGKSLLTTASNSVQTFSTQVGDGFNTLIESVESSLGVPDPESLAKADDATEPDPKTGNIVTHEPEAAKVGTSKDVSSKVVEELAEASMEDTDPSSASAKTTRQQEGKDAPSGEPKGGGGDGGGGGNSWFASWGVADLAKKVQDTGKTLAAKGSTLMTEGFDAMENLAAGSIDVLETIGKKTYNTLSEHDPALRKTREFLSPKSNKPNLSILLREAKEKAEEEAVAEKEKEEARKAHFGTLFDDYQGIAHLEALEMLSNQSEKKVHSLLNSLSTQDLAEIKPKLLAIKGAFDLDEDEESAEGDSDFSSLVIQCVSELELGTAPDKLNKVHQMVKQWIADFDSIETHGLDTAKEVHEKSIQALAELTSKGVEQFHKAGELVLLEKDDKDCTERAHSLARLTGVLCHEIGNLSGKFVQCLNKVAGEDKSEVTPMVTNVYLEASNSSTYIQDAFLLLLPVLQHAALQNAIMSRQST